MEAVGILEGSEDEDDTGIQYCSDDSNCGGRDHMSRDDDDLQDNLWENMYSKTALCFGFLALYSEHVWYAQLL